MMISANAFDVMGARACGFRGAFVDRYDLPYDDTPYVPDVIPNARASTMNKLPLPEWKGR